MGKARALTPKQRKFAHAYVEAGNACEAYREHYNVSKMNPGTARREATRLLANPLIATYIRKLQAKQRQRHEVTVEGLVDELEEARFFAMVFGHISAAVAATMGKAKLHGLITDNLKIDSRDVLKQLSDEQLIERIREVAQGVVDRAGGPESKPKPPKPRAA